MALAGETLREFLIGISYGINQASEEAAKASMKRVEQADKHLVEATRQNNRDLEILNRRRAEEAEAHARRFAENVNNHIVGALRRVVTEIGVLAVAVAGIRALENTFSRIREISELSKRTGAAANDIQDLSAAFKSLGSSEAEAKSALEGITNAINANRGVLQSMKAQGVTETQAGLKQMEQISAALKRITRENGRDVALQFGQLWGLSAEHVRIMTDNYGKDEGAYANHLSRMQTLRNAWKVDLDKAVRDNRKLQEELDTTGAHVDNFQKKIVEGLTPVITAFIRPLNDALLRAAPHIATAIEAISNSLQGWAEEKGNALTDWIEKVSQPNTQERKDLVKWLDLFGAAITNLGNALTDFPEAAKKFKRLRRPTSRPSQLTPSRRRWRRTRRPGRSRRASGAGWSACSRACWVKGEGPGGGSMR
jgi:NADH dehydrogenase/NADH:ubiquinone oxidoreductase subunit G